MAGTGKSNNIPKEMQQRFDEISKKIIDLCEVKLNDEYKQICLQLCATLCRKRPSPIVSGKANTWACGIIHAIGTANFLFDSTQKPHMKSSELYEWFGISQSTGGGKSKQIRDLLKIRQCDVKWTLPSQMDSNPMAWMIQVNGIVLDARYCNPEIQLEAYRRGFIPYLPGSNHIED